MKPSRIHRLLKLITLLQTGRGYLANDLAKEIAVSRRTLFRDLTMLKLAGVPIVYNKAHHSYAIEKSFFLPPVNFTFSEVLALMMLVHKCASRRAIPNIEPASAALLKIESTLPAEIQEYCGTTLDAIAVRHGPISDASTLGDTFDLIWQSITKHQTVALSYDSYFEKAEIETRLNPYHLTFINRGWYVIGYSGMHKEVRTFKLERIVHAQVTGDHFPIDPDFDPARYFGNAWQMIPGDKRHRVRIRFSPKVAGNVDEVLWHPTQQTSYLEDGSLIYEAEVDGVREMAWWVLGYGREAVVEKPAALRKIIAEHIRAMADNYSLS